MLRYIYRDLSTYNNCCNITYVHIFQLTLGGTGGRLCSFYIRTHLHVHTIMYYTKVLRIHILISYIEQTWKHGNYSSNPYYTCDGKNSQSKIITN